jgi:hypothetical protein
MTEQELSRLIDAKYSELGRLFAQQNAIERDIDALWKARNILPRNAVKPLALAMGI